MNVDVSPEGFDPGCLGIRDAARRRRPVVVEAAIDAEFAKLVARATDRAAARNLTNVAYYQQLGTINGKAQLLGEFEVMHGDYRKLFDLPAAIARVTREDIRTAAKELLVAHHRTVGVLVPPSPGASPIAHAAGEG